MKPIHTHTHTHTHPTTTQRAEALEGEQSVVYGASDTVSGSIVMHVPLTGEHHEKDMGWKHFAR